MLPAGPRPGRLILSLVFTRLRQLKYTGRHKRHFFDKTLPRSTLRDSFSRNPRSVVPLGLFIKYVLVLWDYGDFGKAHSSRSLYLPARRHLPILRAFLYHRHRYRPHLRPLVLW